MVRSFLPKFRFACLIACLPSLLGCLIDNSSLTCLELNPSCPTPNQLLQHTALSKLIATASIHCSDQQPWEFLLFLPVKPSTSSPSNRLMAWLSKYDQNPDTSQPSLLPSLDPKLHHLLQDPCNRSSNTLLVSLPSLCYCLFNYNHQSLSSQLSQIRSLFCSQPTNSSSFSLRKSQGLTVAHETLRDPPVCGLPKALSQGGWGMQVSRPPDISYI